MNLESFARGCLVGLTAFLLLAPGRLADLTLGGFVTLTDALTIGVSVVVVVALRPVFGWKLPLAFGTMTAAVGLLHGVQNDVLMRTTLGLVDFLVPIFVGVLLATAVSRSFSTDSVIWYAVLLGGLIAAEAIITAVVPPSVLLGLGLEPFWSHGSTRGFSTFGGPNLTAGILALLLPFGLHFALGETRVGVARVTTAMMIAGLLATLTRGAWLAAFVGASLFVVLHQGAIPLVRRGLIVTVMVLPGIALVLSPLMVHDPSAAQRVLQVSQQPPVSDDTGLAVSPGETPPSNSQPAAEIGTSKVLSISASPAITRLVGSNTSDTSISDRLEMVGLALEVIRVRPWTGYGLNVVMNDSYHQTKYFSTPLQHLHNAYLQLAVNLGVPLALSGIGFVGWLTLRGVHYGLRHPWTGVLVLATSLIVAAVHSLTDYFLWYPRYSVLFWFLVAYLGNQVFRQNLYEV